MKKYLSVPATYFFKIIFPILWIAIVVGFYLVISFSERRNEIQPFGYWVIVTVITLLILRWSFNLKRVQIDENNLYVSNFRQEVTIPLNQVEEVTQNFLQRGNIETITITLKNECALGKKFTFIPCMRFWNIGKHPLVSEIQKKVDSAKYNSLIVGKR